MKKQNLFICAWQYPGVHSPEGAALAKRVGQIAIGFADQGWDVTVVHCDHINENLSAGEFVLEQTKKGNTVRRFPVKRPELPSSTHNVLFRKISTFVYAYFRGDRSADWAEAAKKLFESAERFGTPDLVIGFFTPRGPLSLARFISEKYKTPWFADLQDSYDEGCKELLRPFVRHWTKKNLKTASKIIHVSPEWAERDGKILGLPIVCLRHAVPKLSLNHESIHSSELRNVFTILYAGMLDPSKQPPALFIQAIEELRQEQGLGLEVFVAGQEQVYRNFTKEAKDASFVKWLGWLDIDSMRKTFQKADCLLIISWADPTRTVVPSKLYEYLAYGKPVLIAGKDTGSISALLREWGHADVVCESSEQIKSALIKAINGDYSQMLLPSQCRNVPLTEDGLIQEYLNFYKALNTSNLD